MIHITHRDHMRQNIEPEFVALIEYEEPMREAITQDCEVIHIQLLVATECNGDLQFPYFFWCYGTTVGARGTDGKKSFKIKCPTSEWVERMHDLRHFTIHSSRRMDLLGTRKVGWCNGNLY